MQEDANSAPGGRLAYCFHFEKEPSKSHGVPFVFLVKEGEVFADTKERLSKRTGINMPGYFSFLTILAFHIFLRERVDCVVLEVGIGGECGALVPAPLLYTVK